MGRGLVCACVFLGFVFAYGFGKLVGARRVAFATDSRQKILDRVDILTLHTSGYALQIAAATADKPNVMHFVVRVHVK